VVEIGWILRSWEQRFDDVTPILTEYIQAGAARATATATTKTAVLSAKMLLAQSQFGNNHSYYYNRRTGGE
jgi:hypothetical protein